MAVDALTACANGYHFSSLWEILDPSNLEYNTELGRTRADSGQGPPSQQSGWIRTGYKTDKSITEGRGNCDVWTDSGEEGYASTVRLADDWYAGGEIGPWKSGVGRCSPDGDRPGVWCVED